MGRISRQRFVEGGVVPVDRAWVTGRGSAFVAVVLVVTGSLTSSCVSLGAKRLIRLGRYGEVLQRLDRAGLWRPALRARALAGLGRTEAAWRQAEQAVQKRPVRSNLLLAAHLAHRLGRDEAAIEALERVQGLETSDRRLLAGLRAARAKHLAHMASDEIHADRTGKDGRGVWAALSRRGGGCRGSWSWARCAQALRGLVRRADWSVRRREVRRVVEAWSRNQVGKHARVSTRGRRLGLARLLAAGCDRGWTESCGLLERLALDDAQVLGAWWPRLVARGPKGLKHPVAFVAALVDQGLWSGLLDRPGFEPLLRQHAVTRAVLLWRGGHHAVAMKVLDELLRAKRFDPSVRLNLARVALRWNDPDSAIAHLAWAEATAAGRGSPSAAPSVVSSPAQGAAIRSARGRSFRLPEKGTVRGVPADVARQVSLLRAVASRMATVSRMQGLSAGKALDWERLLASSNSLPVASARPLSHAVSGASSWAAGVVGAMCRSRFGGEAALSTTGAGTVVPSQTRQVRAVLSTTRRTQAKKSYERWVRSGPCRPVVGSRAAWYPRLLVLAGDKKKAASVLADSVGRGPDGFGLCRVPWALKEMDRLGLKWAAAQLAWSVAQRFSKEPILLEPAVRALILGGQTDRAVLTADDWLTSSHRRVHALTKLVRWYLHGGRCEEAGAALGRLLQWTDADVPVSLGPTELVARLWAHCGRRRLLADGLAKWRAGTPASERPRLAEAVALVLIDEGRADWLGAMAQDLRRVEVRIRWLVATGKVGRALRLAATWSDNHPLMGGAACSFGGLTSRFGRGRLGRLFRGAASRAWIAGSPCVKRLFVRDAIHHGRWATAERILLHFASVRGEDWADRMLVDVYERTKRMGRAVAVLAAVSRQGRPDREWADGRLFEVASTCTSRMGVRSSDQKRAKRRARTR